MRWIGVALFLVAIFLGPPFLFLETWLGGLIVASSIIAIIVGVVLMLQPYSAREAAGGTQAKDLMGLAIVAGGLVGTVLVAGVIWRLVGR